MVTVLQLRVLSRQGTDKVGNRFPSDYGPGTG